MGIKRFGLRMRDHAVRTILGSTESPAEKTIAIVDGPGLAHHVFYQLCDQSKSDFSYSSCVQAATKWLKDLQSIGFKIEAIFFDGALPASKKDVRIGRLQSYVDRLLAYKQSLSNTPPTFSRHARKTLSPPPFLVFAIVEELLNNTDFAEVTFMVPGEADPYCAAAAQADKEDCTVTIFSDDADLLVYGLGQSTSVVPFRDLSISQTTSNITWTGEQYIPSEIVKHSRITKGDLIEPAYLMDQDHYLSFDKACQMLKSTDPCKEPDFTAFEQTFQTTSEATEWTRIRSRVATKSSVPGRDSRISELIYQLENQEQGGLRMYLPFVFDDPSKKTAWIIGTDLRTLAYSTLLHHAGTDSSVQEYRRSGSRIASTLVESLSIEDTVEQVNKLKAHLQQMLAWATESHNLSQTDAWRCIILQHVLANLQSDGYPLPQLEDILHTVMHEQPSKWHLVRLSGQYQAAFYSLRMAKQIMAHIAAHEDEQHSPFRKAVQDLAQRLDSLPRISAFLCESGLDKETWHTVIGDVLSTLKESDEVEEDRPRKKAKKAKKKGEPKPAALESNPFAMLADE